VWDFTYCSDLDHRHRPTSFYYRKDDRFALIDLTANRKKVKLSSDFDNRKENEEIRYQKPDSCPDQADPG
jgi:hypothetical protein